MTNMTNVKLNAYHTHQNFIPLIPFRVQANIQSGLFQPLYSLKGTEMAIRKEREENEILINWTKKKYRGKSFFYTTKNSKTDF